MADQLGKDAAVPRTWRMSLSHRWFVAVADALKRFEGRRWSGDPTKIATGDSIEFRHADDPARCVVRRVVAVHRFPTFEAALAEFADKKQLGAVLPGVASVAEGVEIYLRFVSLATQQRDGVCLIELVGDQPTLGAVGPASAGLGCTSVGTSELARSGGAKADPRN